MISLQSIHCNQFTAINSLQSIHCNHFTAINSLQSIHRNQFTKGRKKKKEDRRVGQKLVDKVLVKGTLENARSQHGYIIALMPAHAINAEGTTIHPICWSSTTICRACRATLMAETLAMVWGTEAGARIRAAIVDAIGKLDNTGRSQQLR